MAKSVITALDRVHKPYVLSSNMSEPVEQTCVLTRSPMLSDPKRRISFVRMPAEAMPTLRAIQKTLQPVRKARGPKLELLSPRQGHFRSMFLDLCP